MCGRCLVPRTAKGANVPERRPNAKPPGHDYLLRVTDATGRVTWHQTIVKGFMSATADRRLAWKFRGAGLASAVTALTKRGYEVEKVLAP